MYLTELVIRNGKFILPEGVVRGELSVEDGRISRIAVSGLPMGEREIDAHEKLIIPGVIDAHVHFYDKNFAKREDYASGSSAAAAGGVTTVIIMPLDTPVLSRSSIREVINAGQRDSVIDFSWHAGNMTPELIKNVPEVSSLGVKSFKAFTCAPYLMEYSEIKELMLSVKAAGGVTFVHAEDEQILVKKFKQVQNERRKDVLAHADSRPNEAEERATEKIAELAKQTGCSVHLAHITTDGGCEVIKNAKKLGAPLTAETSTHSLVFTREDIPRLGPYLKVNPPLKTSRDRASLWRAVSKKIIDIVATDHAPGLREEKDAGWKDIWKAPSGVPGVETLLPIMLSEGVGNGRITMERMVDSLCAMPARIFGLYPRKGVIQEGSDADLVMLDLKREVTISAEKLHYKVGWTPYEGMKVRGVPVMTILRGRVLAEEGEIFGASGYGQFLPR